MAQSVGVGLMLPINPPLAEELEAMAAEFFAANPDLNPATYRADPEDHCPYWQLPDCYDL